MVKMETRHPVEGQFGSEFLAICNHCGHMLSASKISAKTDLTKVTCTEFQSKTVRV